MMTGEVIANESGDGTILLQPRVSVEVSGSDSVSRTVEAAIDTGFTSYLTLAEEVIEDLRLRLMGTRSAYLADGSEKTFKIYGAVIHWHDRYQPILVHQAESVPLIGMSLLNGSSLFVEALESGKVVIEEISQE